MTAPIVAMDRVLFRWRSDAPVCLDIESFRLLPGERLFLHGPSGSGKSTLLSLIGGVAVPERGNIEVLGKSLLQQRPSARDRHRAEHIGFIFQMFNLIPYLSALDNILLPCRFSAHRRQKIAAKGSAAAEEARRLASHLCLTPEVLTRAAHHLSVGQQQRVAAARALIGQPELIIADEPTSALDTENQQAFLQLLLTECHSVGAAILFVSHDTRLAADFDRVVALADINRATDPGATK